MNYPANVNFRIRNMNFNCTCTECGKDFERYISKETIERALYCPECSTLSDKTLSQELLRKYFLYIPSTGELIYKLPNGTGKNVGDTFGHLGNHGYLCGYIGDKSYLVHRLIWLYLFEYMPEQIDHIDHNRTNNRISNLREVSNLENHKNCSVSKNSSTGVNGVCLHRPTGKYRAYIMVNRKQIHLGLFDTIEEATLARENADIQHNFHQNHGK